MKNLPPELAKWYFPFNWDVEAVWRLSGKIKQCEIETIEWHLEKPLWSSTQGSGMLFDLKPIDVITNPQKHTYHWNRISQASTKYPICITEFKGREIIIDGIHRLARFVIKKIETIDIMLIDENELNKIITRA